jgi:serine phosphatase RsbU (regulator of sigma subunit)
MKNRQHSELWLIALAGAGLLVTVLLFQKTYPQAGIKGTQSRHEIIRQAHAVLEQLNFPYKELEPTVDFRPNHELLAFAQVNFGTAEANRLFRRDLPAFVWNVRFGKPPLLKNLLGGRMNEEQIAETFVRHYWGEIRMQFDLHGRLLALDILDEDKQDTTKPSLNEAIALAERFLPLSPLADMENVALAKSQATMQKNRTDYTLIWSTPAPMVGLTAQLEATIQGARARHWELTYLPALSVYKPNFTLPLLLRVLVVILLLVCGGFFFFKKLRADEISLKAGLPAGIVMAAGLVLYFLTDPTQTFFAQLIQVLLAPGFVILAFVIVYGTGESLMRDLGQERLLSFEAAQHGRWWFRPLGESLWRGAAFSLILFGGITAILYFFGQRFQAYFDPPMEIEKQALVHYTAILPSVSVIGESLYYTLFLEAAFRLFLISVLSRFLRRSWGVAGVVALFSAASPTPLLQWSPFGFIFMINFLLGLALTFIYLRCDFLTTVSAAILLPALFNGLSFIHADKVVNPLHGWILLSLPILFIGGGQIIRRFGKVEIDARALQPDYLDRLAEKERIKRELEIARQVQLKFLPRALPAMPGLEIAALCLPANEVGGDYYDFVRLGPHRLGVLVGDVSGKGILAAFYMTLAKGIIKSSIQENLSPSQALIRANQLFYENVDRGIFVSLVYGVFDLEQRTFTSARAGHNPILLLRHNEHNATLVSPQGFALGLEHGELFRRNIQEQTVALNSGDVFVFYTDGFTEAMNGQKEEFGEARVIASLSKGAGVSSQETITHARHAVQRFTGNAPQHDDMTMVVVKVR